MNHLVEIHQLLTDEPRVAMTHRPTHIPTPNALERPLACLEFYLKYQ